MSISSSNIFDFNTYLNADFKKFFKRLFIYFIILTAITLAVNYRFVAMRGGDNNTGKFQNVPYNIKIFNFGSSHGAASFNYDDIHDYTCFNFAMGSQSLSYDNRILKYFFSHITDGGIAFIDISYFSFFGLPETQQFDFLSKNQRYYKFLDSKFIKLYDPWAYLYINEFPSLTAYNQLFKILSKSGDLENSIITAEKLDLKQHALYRYDAHILRDKFDENGKRIYNQEEIDALYEMINLLKSKNITPILITTPYMSEYVDIVYEKQPEFFDDFYSLINKICADTGVKYYDYSRDERFKNDRILFSDTDHLNQFGARKFTKIVFDEIINKEIVNKN